jgi:hypothetical protein
VYVDEMLSHQVIEIGVVSCFFEFKVMLEDAVDKNMVLHELIVFTTTLLVEDYLIVFTHRLALNVDILTVSPTFTSGNLSLIIFSSVFWRR